MTAFLEAVVEEKDKAAGSASVSAKRATAIDRASATNKHSVKPGLVEKGYRKALSAKASDYNARIRNKCAKEGKWHVKRSREQVHIQMR